MKVGPQPALPVFSSVYEVAGRLLLIDVSDQHTASSIRSYLNRWNLLLIDGAHRPEPHAVIHFRQGELPSIPEHFEPFPISDTVTGYATDTAYCVDFGAARMFADESWLVTVWFDIALDEQSILLQQLLSHAVPAALRRCGAFELHSAAVTDPVSGKSILICGATGSGKSTLTLQLAASGWSYLTDDVVLLVEETRGIKATGLRRFVTLDKTVGESGLSTIDSFLIEPNDGSYKHRFMPEALFPNGAVTECYPNVILFPVMTDHETSTTKELSPTETMYQLIRVCPWSCNDRAVARVFLDVLDKLVKQSVGIALMAGSDLMGDAAYAANFLTARIQEA